MKLIKCTSNRNKYIELWEILMRFKLYLCSLCTPNFIMNYFKLMRCEYGKLWRRIECVTNYGRINYLKQWHSFQKPAPPMKQASHQFATLTVMASVQRVMLGRSYKFKNAMFILIMCFIAIMSVSVNLHIFFF